MQYYEIILCILFILFNKFYSTQCLNIYCRTTAALLTVEKQSATGAKRAWGDLHRNELVQGQKSPSKMLFYRNKRKLEEFGSVENRVCLQSTIVIEKCVF